MLKQPRGTPAVWLPGERRWESVGKSGETLEIFPALNQAHDRLPIVNNVSTGFFLTDALFVCKCFARRPVWRENAVRMPLVADYPLVR